MDYFSAQISQLVLEVAGNKKSFVRSFVAKPPLDQQKKQGVLFGLVEINSSHLKIPSLINLVIEEIKDSYYSRPISTETENYLEAAFEASLQRVNIAIAAFLETEQIVLNLEKINIIIGVINNKDLYFSYVGKLDAFLFQFLQRNEYRIIDIFQITRTPLACPNPLKLFSQIISGHINARDILFLATPNLFDYFSLEKIKNIITDFLSLPEAMIELKKILKNIGQKDDFGAMAIEIEKKLATTQTADFKTINQSFDYQTAASSDSMKDLIRTQNETEKFLTPSVGIEFKKYVNYLSEGIKNYGGKIVSPMASKLNQIFRRTKVNPPQDKFKTAIRQNLQHFQKLTEPLKTRLASQKLTSRLAKFKEKLQPAGQLIFGQLIQKFGRLPKSSKILLTTSLILAILFFSSIIWLGINNQRQKENEAFTKITLAAEMKKNEAEASLIYRDENQARKILLEAKNSLAEFKTKNKQYQQQIASLLTTIEESLQKLRHLIEITEPILIVNFENLDNQANLANFLLPAGNNIYVANLNKNLIYRTNLNSRSTTQAPITATVNKGFAAGDNEFILADDKNKFFTFSPATDTFADLTLTLPANLELADLTAYNGRLYLLDKKNNSIFRYIKSGNSYTGKSWLTDSQVSLADAAALTVDGNIYVLKTSGEILKLENGQSVDFKLPVIEPALSSPTKIKTFAGSNYLYILDPGTKRLVVISKDGNLTRQYVSPAFDNLKDFTVVESDRKIYLLNKNSVFGLPIDYLK